MFEATFIQSNIFKQVIEAMKDLVNEANFECTSGGITVQAMESSHISLVSLSLNTSTFENYRCDRNIVLGLNIAGVSKILKCLEAGDTLSISAGDDTDVVTFSIASKYKDKLSNFELKLMNIDAESLSIPDEAADVELSLPSSKLNQLCRDLLNFGDTVKIVANKSMVQFIAEGNLASAKIILQPGSEAGLEDESGQIKIECTEEVDQSYSLKFLNFFAKASPLCKEASVQLSSTSPLCVEYKLNDGEWGLLRYYLAPKMKDSNEEKE